MSTPPTASPPADSSSAPARLWASVAGSASFRALVRARSRFVNIALAIGLTWFTVFIVLVGYAPEVLGISLHRGLNLAYAVGLSQFVLVWLITWAYLRRSARVFTSLERAALDDAAQEEVRS